MSDKILPIADREQTLATLADVAKTCTQCRLSETRKNVVFAKGSYSAPIMLIGEAPGADEDEQGIPYVGKSGKYLSQLLAASKLPESEIYTANVLKCRPPNNKFPDGVEPETCRGYLLKQIELVKPKAIIITGKQALKYLLLHNTAEKPDPLYGWINNQYRRKDTFGDIMFLVVYHPAYLIRSNNEEETEAWIQAVAQLWNYVQHKLNNTTPPPCVFKEISTIESNKSRMGRSIFKFD